MKVNELIYNVDKARERLESLKHAINQMMGRVHKGTWLEDAEKDTRYAVKLLVSHYKQERESLDQLLNSDLDTAYERSVDDNAPVASIFD